MEVLTVKIGLLGAGTIGFGVVELADQTDDLKIIKILDRRDIPELRDRLTTVPDSILEDPEIDTVIELLGGVEPAFTWVSKALLSGKNVVTANKFLVSEKLPELLEAARKGSAQLRFSAAVGGGIPILVNLLRARRLDTVQEVGGVLNGTTNYILTKMAEDGLDFDVALKQAQELGYAEADPTADVSGLDTLRKVILLSAVSFGLLPVDGMLLEGIENIDLFREPDSKVRLIGCCGKNENGTVYSYVEPVLLKPYSTFAGVTSNFNQVMYKGKNSGTISLYGQGAGRYPTASAVLRDLTAIAAGERAMLPESCVGCTADNRFIKHKYYISEGNKSHITDFVSVADMHREAKEMRESGRKVFFAEIEE